jgi:hypothetical protein
MKLPSRRVPHIIYTSINREWKREQERGADRFETTKMELFQTIQYQSKF